MKQRKKDVSNKIGQRKASSKDKTKDIRTFFKITEKQGNVPVDIIEID